MKKLLLIALVLLLPAQAFGLTDAQRQSVQYGAVYYDGSSNCQTVAIGGGAVNTAPPNQVQVGNAKIVIGVAKTNNLGKQGALIGLMVALAESTLTNLANKNVSISESNPAKEGDGSDHDSVGVFQQRPSTGWSTLATGPAADSNKDAVWQIMTPAYAAEAFFGSPPGSSAPSALSKGLQNIAGWQSLDPAVAAQKVQASGDPTGSNYRRQQAAAQVLVDQYFDAAPAVPLPVPFTAGPGAGNSSPSASSCANSGSVAGCVNPFTDAGWGLARTDQGVDYIPNKPLAVRAICDGTILSTDGSGWPFDATKPGGGPFIFIKLTSGPFAGKCTYVSEHLINVLPVGTHVTAGQEIATALPGYAWTEWGWASAPQTPSSRYNGAPDGTSTLGGQAFARFLRHLGADTKENPGPGPEYDGGSCP